MGEEIIPRLTTGHIVSDIALWSFVVVLVLFRAVEELRRWGVIPEKVDVSGAVNVKTVGRLSIESLKTIVRHEVRDTMQPVMLKMGEYNSRQLDKLEEINLGIREIVTVLRERR